MVIYSQTWSVGDVWSMGAGCSSMGVGVLQVEAGVWQGRDAGDG